LNGRHYSCKSGRWEPDEELLHSEPYAFWVDNPYALGQLHMACFFEVPKKEKLWVSIPENLV
jgi:hypothetical protein